MHVDKYEVGLSSVDSLTLQTDQISTIFILIFIITIPEMYSLQLRLL